jgi:hypothetical protein
VSTVCGRRVQRDAGPAPTSTEALRIRNFRWERFPAGALSALALLLGHVVLAAVQRTDSYLTALGIVLTLTCAVGLLFRARRRVARLGWTRGRFSPRSAWA